MDGRRDGGLSARETLHLRRPRNANRRVRIGADHLSAPIMNPIVDWAKLDLAKEDFKAPPAHYGAWVVICLYKSENDRLGTHCDNDYWAKEYNKIVLMTAIGSASLALNPTTRLKAPIYDAETQCSFSIRMCHTPSKQQMKIPGLVSRCASGRLAQRNFSKSRIGGWFHRLSWATPMKMITYPSG